ncbi:esterase FrsA [Parasalinivibrio latis]|uniref:esterase FrsA n=1 Tax=Parasalinivibrio latis TaxID=2952610 RepID=UPI0030E5A39E
MTSSESENLSIKLFKKQKEAAETSTLIGSLVKSPFSNPIDGENEANWYRMLRRPQWVWQGVEPLEMEEIFARIAASTNPRSHEGLLDTVIGNRSGNWVYEWTNAGMRYQRDAIALADKKDLDAAFLAWMKASIYFTVASYPHLKGDPLGLQSETLAYKAFKEAVALRPYRVRSIETRLNGKALQGFLMVPHTDHPVPTIIVSGGLDTLQIELWKLFENYLAPAGFAMMCVDMPSVGYSQHWNFTEDTSALHQALLDEVERQPWVAPGRIGVMGMRFGANAAIRLSFVEQQRISSCVSLGGVFHSALTDRKRLQTMPPMYLDMMASRLGVEPTASMITRLQAWSLKNQGLLSGRKTQVPILALSLKDDPVCPHSDNQMAAMWSVGGKAVSVKTTRRHDGYHEALKRAVDWFKQTL